MTTIVEPAHTAPELPGSVPGVSGFRDVSGHGSGLAGKKLRFERAAICSIFGDPLDRRTWSSAPFNIARRLQQYGVAVEGFSTGIPRGELAVLAAHYTLRGYGAPRNSEAVLRSPPARRHAADRLALALRRRGIQHVIHTGTMDLLPSRHAPELKHYLYCDQTWALSLLYRPDRDSYRPRAVEAFDLLEAESLACAEHIFTFGTYVRDHIIDHYGIPAEKVTAVGSGMGEIEPNHEPKDYTQPRLLFVAKHLFAAKGGHLLLDAFRIARTHRPDLTLTIVGDERSRPFVPDEPGIIFRAHVPWTELQQLFRDATLFTQPMLNDPWGQVYLEALLSRTPVLGLRRNGLPEITEDGRHGFLVDKAEPEAVAAAILDAISDPERLSRMGISGQQHVLRSYSWDIAAQRIAFV
ncbi:glycosyltransferase family 4 protein [uncultured Ferrovibrio sp.]|uniref:glycosyltransferase family 4 protein n=1 Tax=uncultured Ferrovibrio sp. TaxID=1576913 RepID=UPI00260C3CB8|nr:glycosyltransferase family 4 protein [uncultured Ferrovibrio sp.]